MTGRDEFLDADELIDGPSPPSPRSGTYPAGLDAITLSLIAATMVLVFVTAVAAIAFPVQQREYAPIASLESDRDIYLEIMAAIDLAKERKRLAAEEARPQDVTAADPETLKIVLDEYFRPDEYPRFRSLLVARHFLIAAETRDPEISTDSAVASSMTPTAGDAKLRFPRPPSRGRTGRYFAYDSTMRKKISAIAPPPSGLRRRSACRRSSIESAPKKIPLKRRRRSGRMISTFASQLRKRARRIAGSGHSAASSAAWC